MAKTSLAMLIALAAAGCGGGLRQGPAPTPPPQAQAMVLVCDSTQSMSGKLDAVKADMKRLLSGVLSDNLFAVLTYDRLNVRQSSDGLRSGTNSEQLMARQFVDDLKPQGRAKPQPALQAAMSMLASASNRNRSLYFWSDADFAPGIIGEAIKPLNNLASPVRLNFIVVVSPGVEPNQQVVEEMKQLAAQTGGTFRTIPTSSGATQ
jgi:hypothetical protein